ncbi:MAG: SDR family oxidoreductase [Cyclobacteriaceae bacterium]|nr:SDR family oxidoreductase [Cyclobacteriaceae bacterium]
MSRYLVKDKVAIVTGSSQGIGKAIAIALCAKGAKVVLNSRSLEPLQKTEAELKSMGFEVLAVQGDVSIYEDCERLVNETVSAFGQIDILINNAAISSEGSIQDTSPEVFEKMFRVNLMGVINPTKAALSYIKKTKGSIVFTGSISGFMGLPNYSAYSSSKMALTSLVQALKLELVGTGVHVGLNYVGFTENEEHKTFITAEGNLEAVPVRKQFAKMSREKVANHFVKGIEKRKYKQTLTLLGKILKLVQQYFPAIFERVLILVYKRQQKNNIMPEK